MRIANVYFYLKWKKNWKSFGSDEWSFNWTVATVAMLLPFKLGSQNVFEIINREIECEIQNACLALFTCDLCSLAFFITLRLVNQSKVKVKIPSTHELTEIFCSCYFFCMHFEFLKSSLPSWCIMMCDLFTHIVSLLKFAKKNIFLLFFLLRFVFDVFLFALFSVRDEKISLSWMEKK